MSVIIMDGNRGRIMIQLIFSDLEKALLNNTYEISASFHVTVHSALNNMLCCLHIIAILRIPHHSSKEDIRNTDSY